MSVINENEKKDRSISYYMVPFCVKNVQKYLRKIEKSEQWSEWYNSPRYLSGYICDYFHERSEDNDKCHYMCKSFILSRERAAELEINQPFILNSSIFSKQESYEISLSEIILYIFSTGMCFLRFGVVNANNNLTDITNINFYISRLFMPGGRFSIKSQTDVDLGYILNQLIALGKKDVLLPERKFLSSYHILLDNKKTKGDENNLRDLCRGNHFEFESSKKASYFEDGMFQIEPIEAVIWTGSANGVAVNIYDDKKKMSEDNCQTVGHMMYVRAKHDYFLLYLLAIHERELLLYYGRLVSRAAQSEDRNEIALIRKKLVEFNTIFCFETVSQEMGYQILYNNIDKVFRLEELEESINESMDGLNTYISDKREQRINGLLSAIGLLAVISAFADGLALVDRIQEGTGIASLGPGHWGIITIVLGIIFVGLLSFIKKK